MCSGTDDANHLDFRDEEFDAVISNYVYHNIMGADMQKLGAGEPAGAAKAFGLNDDEETKLYGDMDVFAQKLREMGYQDVRQTDTAEEAFGSHRRGAMMMLGSFPVRAGESNSSK